MSQKLYVLMKLFDENEYFNMTWAEADEKNSIQCMAIVKTVYWRKNKHDMSNPAIVIVTNLGSFSCLKREFIKFGIESYRIKYKTTLKITYVISNTDKGVFNNIVDLRLV